MMNKILTIVTAFIAASALTSCAAGDALKNAAAGVVGFFTDDTAVSTNSGTEEDALPSETAAFVSNDINIGVYGFDTYDPLTTASSTVADVCGFIFEPLFGLDEQHRAVPVLAESLERSADGMTAAVHIKQNIMWHDGSALTSADVVYTINRLKLGTRNYSHLASVIASAYASDQNTVTVTFTRPMQQPETILSFPIVKNGSEFSASPAGPVVGTGPFFMAGADGRDRYRLAAFESYHGGRASLDSVYVIIIPDKEKYLSLFDANEIDIATSEELDMSSYMPKSNANVTDMVSDTMVFMGFNTTDSMLSDAGTRRAVSMLIDRDGIAERIYYSRAQAADYAINPASWLAFDTRESLGADAYGAAELLSAAGWKTDEDGQYFREQGRRTVYLRLGILVNSDDPERVAAAENICQSLETAGISAYVDECRYDEYMRRVAARDYRVFIGETDILPNGDLTELAGSGGNYFGYANADIDTFLTQLGTAMSDEDMKTVMISFYEKLRSESPFAPICFMKKSIVTSAKIRAGVVPSESGYVRAAQMWRVTP